MSPRRGGDTEENPAAPSEMLDLLTAEAREVLRGWASRDRVLFDELLEDAATELQGELLRRALAARHTPAELHAFADKIRGLSDAALYSAITADRSRGGVRFSVVQRMRAEADPLYAFTLNGHSLTGDDVESGVDALGLPRRARPNFEPRVPPASPAPAPRSANKRELGASPEGAPVLHKQTVSRSGEAGSLFHTAVLALGHGYRERAVAQPDIPLVVDLILTALQSGFPVPLQLGGSTGTPKRWVLALQSSVAGKGQALQLHEPRSGQTHWVNAADLKHAGELPFTDKGLRRLTRVALPLPPRSP